MITEFITKLIVTIVLFLMVGKIYEKHTNTPYREIEVKMLSITPETKKKPSNRPEMIPSGTFTYTVADWREDMKIYERIRQKLDGGLIA